MNLRFTSLNELATTVLDSIPFCHWMGISVETLNDALAVIHFNQRKELIGNPFQGILHGGVIAAVLDSIGGLMVMVNVFQRMEAATHEEQLAKLSKVSTIDIHVDYLRPGKGHEFRASAKILRSGNKVAVTQMELHNDKSELLAVATATYLIG